MPMVHDPRLQEPRRPVTGLLEFETTHQGGLEGIRKTLSKVIDQLDLWGFENEDCDIAQLLVAEVLNNILEHAYGGENSDNPIWLSGRVKEDGLHLRFLDEGRPMPKGELPLGNAPDLKVEVLDMPEGGFGWFLIKDLARDLHYKRIDSQNQLDFRLAIRPTPQTSTCSKTLAD